MKLSLNLKPVEVPGEVSSLDQLVDYLESKVLKPGHVITRIVVDGSEIDEDQELDMAGKSLDGIEIVEVHSARTVDLAKEGMEDATQLLPSLAEDLPVVASELRSGNVADGLEMFSRCVEVISWYVSLVSAVDIIFRQTNPTFRVDPAAAKSAEDLSPETDPMGLTSEDETELRTFASIENLRQKLLDIEQAQLNNDSLLLADLVEYEVLPIVKIWSDEVPLLLAKVKMEGGTA